MLDEGVVLHRQIFTWYNEAEEWQDDVYTLKLNTSSIKGDYIITVSDIYDKCEIYCDIAPCIKIHQKPPEDSKMEISLLHLAELADSFFEKEIQSIWEGDDE